MSSVNKATILGNLGADPEVRRTNSGDPIANLRVATTERWRDKQTGERQERTEWHSVVIFGPVAEVAEKYLRKGSKVYLEGQLQTRKWQDKEGRDRYSTEVVLRGPRSTMAMLDGPSESRIGTGPGADQSVAPDFEDSDIPF